MTTEVYFQWRERGGDWTTTTGQVVTESGAFEEDLTSLDTASNGYEFRTVVDADGTISEGDILTFGAELAGSPRSSLRLGLGVSL